MLRVRFASVLRNQNSIGNLFFARWCKTVAESEQETLGLETTELYSPEEIERIRDKSRLPEDIRNKYYRKVYEKSTMDKHYTLTELRTAYGTFGKSSHLNPGLCWPTKEELALQLEYDSLTITPLHEMMDNINKRKKAEANARLKKERDVEKNMLKLAKLNQELREKEKQKEKAALAQKIKKEKVIDEIREQLGYNIDERDPRFRDMLVRREEQLKKEAKAAKKIKQKESRIEYTKKIAAEAGLVTKEKSKADDDD